MSKRGQRRERQARFTLPLSSSLLLSCLAGCLVQAEVDRPGGPGWLGPLSLRCVSHPRYPRHVWKQLRGLCLGSLQDHSGSHGFTSETGRFPPPPCSSSEAEWSCWGSSLGQPPQELSRKQEEISSPSASSVSLFPIPPPPFLILCLIRSEEEEKWVEKREKLAGLALI